MKMDATPLTDKQYRALARTVLDQIEAMVDSWLQNDVIDIDARRSGELLELNFPNGSKLILNTQPPLQELWLAARGGGFHFKYVSGRWLNARDGKEFYDVLSTCATEQSGKSLRFGRGGSENTNAGQV